MSALSFSRLEPIVASYFKLKGYAVFRNIPFKYRGRWKDIDVVAFNNIELYIVECKRGSLSARNLGQEVEKLIDHYKLAEEFLRSTSPYKELIDNLNLEIKKLYIAEYIRGEKPLIEEHNIEVRHAKDILCEIISIIKNLSGEGAYPDPFIRYMVLLAKENLLKEC